MTRVAALAALIALSVPAAACAQDPYLLQRDFEMETLSAQARQRDMATQNELMSFDARLRTDQALRASAPAGMRPIQVLAMPISAPPPVIGPFAAIPDDRLAASNARIRAAAKNRR
jgi:hypothetical protein